MVIELSSTYTIHVDCFNLTDKQKQIIKSSNQQMCSVSFWIYSMSQRETNDAKGQLDKAVLEKYNTEKLHDRLISELRQKEVSMYQTRFIVALFLALEALCIKIICFCVLS